MLQTIPLNGIIAFELTLKNKKYENIMKVKRSLQQAGEKTDSFESFISAIDGSEIYFPNNTSIYSFKMSSGDRLTISEINDDIINAYLFWSSSTSPRELLNNAIREIKHRIKKNSSGTRLKIDFNDTTKLTLIETSFHQGKNSIGDAKHYFVDLKKSNNKLSLKNKIELLVLCSLVLIGIINRQSGDFLFFAFGAGIPLIINLIEVFFRNEYFFDLSPLKSDTSASSVVAPDPQTASELEDPA